MLILWHIAFSTMIIMIIVIIVIINIVGIFIVIVVVVVIGNAHENVTWEILLFFICLFG